MSKFRIRKLDYWLLQSTENWVIESRAAIRYGRKWLSKSRVGGCDRE